MKASIRLLSLAAVACASSASAQTPIYIDLTPGTFPQDITVVPASGGGIGDVIVVGTDSNGDVFRWRLSTGVEVALGASPSGGGVRMSYDGTLIATTTTGTDGFDRATRYNGSTWVQGPGLGGSSGTTESTGYCISGDGNVVAGLAYPVGGSGHAYTWTQPTTTANLGGAFSDPASRLNAINGNGSIVAGFKDLLSGQRAAAYWVNGVLQPQPTLGGLFLGEAQGMNAAGTTIVGGRITGASGANATAAWRWDSGVVTPLPNLLGETTTAVATDVTNDGSIVVGHSGGNIPFGTRDVIWTNNVPQTLHSYLTALGTAGIGGYPDLGLVTAISGDGGAVCGRGTGFGSGQPAGGWVVIFPSALPAGTPFCFGDGTANPCPCGNSGSVGNGCANSVSAAGARLNATGAPSLSNDSLGLNGTGMPNSSALYFQGTTQLNGGLGAAFGDGLRCAGGAVVRLGTKSNVGGASNYPAAGDPTISVRGLVVGVGAVRTYQVWYRNAAAYCTVSTFNLSNGVEIVWGA